MPSSSACTRRANTTTSSVRMFSVMSMIFGISCGTHDTTRTSGGAGAAWVVLGLGLRWIRLRRLRWIGGEVKVRRP